jgi:membrane associated rhomboid family serine protease
VSTAGEPLRIERNTVELSLRDGERVVFGPEGFRHPAALHYLAPVFTRYDTVTHVSVSARTIRVGTRRSVYILNRSSFRSEADAQLFVGQLARSVAAAPDGATRIVRMREIDRLAAQARPQRVTWSFLALCLGVQVLQLFDPGRWEAAGAFSASLVKAGEVWRLVTANLLHAMPLLPVHFVLNGLALLALGALLEWTIGSARTVLVMAVAGVGAMAAGLIVNYEEAVGASGVVMGVFGALVFLELRHGAELPAHWRLPRAVIWMGIALQAGLEFAAWAFFPVIATGAHVGGFASGFVTCALVGRGGLRRAPLPVWVRWVNAVAVVALVASMAGATRAYLQGPELTHRRMAEKLLSRDGVPPQILNNLAWLLATSEDPSREGLEAALELAERAVDATDRREANILDTLAEVHFRRGETGAAIEVIQEAIRLDPNEPYYRGQRERFLGRRDADDRPDPPSFAPEPPANAPLVPDEPEVPA